MNVQHKEVFTYDEMSEAIQALPKHSCTSMDGLTPMFFIKYWDLFKADLCTTFQQILHDDCMPPHYFTQGLIYFIPQSKGPSLDIKK